MEYTLQQKYDAIEKELLSSSSKDPLEIARACMKKEYVSIHGPEHHYLDGGAFLAAYRNAGGEINLESALKELAQRTVKMPGAMCGLWGVCGAVTSVGAALSVLHKTTPLSTDEYYKDNMEYTSSVITSMSKIGGARCCKRNAFLALSTAVSFVKEKYGVAMELKILPCEFSALNGQCIQQRCPLFREKNR